MKKIRRRDKMKIYGDLLRALHHRPKEKKVIITQIQQKTNVPFDRLKTYIQELLDLGLIEDDTSLILSEKGKQYLREYKKVLDFMSRMGLYYR